MTQSAQILTGTGESGLTDGETRPEKGQRLSGRDFLKPNGKYSPGLRDLSHLHATQHLPGASNIRAGPTWLIFWGFQAGESMLISSDPGHQLKQPAPLLGERVWGWGREWSLRSGAWEEERKLALNWPEQRKLKQEKQKSNFSALD